MTSPASQPCEARESSDVNSLNRLALSVALMVLAASGAVQAAGHWPDKPVHLIVPFAAGGPVDTLARAIGSKLSGALGQQVVVENRAGASAMIGTEAVARAEPDGYTLLFTSPGGIVIAPGISKTIRYDPFKDFAPIMHVVSVPEVLVVPPSLGVRTLPALVKDARDNPGKLNFASAGSATLPRLAAELLKQEAKIDIVHVPYKGASPAIADLIAGRVQMMYADLPVVLQQIKAGKLIALAVADKRRAPSLPDVQTSAEGGLPGVIAVNWYALLAPAATPKDVTMVLYKEMLAVLKDPELQSLLANNGAQIVASSPADLTSYMRTEYDKWRAISVSVGVTLD
jgi:tripartite-type tricarboxylate transporter receptor subunit TctC